MWIQNYILLMEFTFTDLILSRSTVKSVFLCLIIDSAPGEHSSLIPLCISQMISHQPQPTSVDLSAKWYCLPQLPLSLTFKNTMPKCVKLQHSGSVLLGSYSNLGLDHLSIYYFNIDLFVLGCTGSSLLHASYPLAVQASHCDVSLAWEHGLQACRLTGCCTQDYCSVACGIFSDQGWNPCSLHWQVASEPLDHQGSFQFNITTKL